MSSTWFWADPHLGHSACLIRDRRPWLRDVDWDPVSRKFFSEDVKRMRTKEMDDDLIGNYNEVVGDKDTAYIVGDFAWRDHEKYARRLRGKKILITGTHDKMPKAALAQFSEVIGSRHRPGLLETSLDGHPVCVCHYALASWNGSCHGVWHAHGHSHGSMTEYPDFLRCDVGVAAWSWRPVNFDVFRLKMESKAAAWKERRKIHDAERFKARARILALRHENEKWVSQWLTGKKTNIEGE